MNRFQVVNGIEAELQQSYRPPFAADARKGDSYNTHGWGSNLA